jgi:hypothetical protein
VSLKRQTVNDASKPRTQVANAPAWLPTEHNPRVLNDVIDIPYVVQEIACKGPDPSRMRQELVSGGLGCILVHHGT